MRNLIRVWVKKLETGVFDDDANAADLLVEYEAKIAALERMVGRQAPVQIGVLLNPADATNAETTLRDVQEAARAIALPINVRFLGVKRTSRFQSAISAFDPKRTLRSRRRMRVV